MSDSFAIGLIFGVAIAVIILLILKNKKDKKLMNPDAQDSVEETSADEERRRDVI